MFTFESKSVSLCNLVRVQLSPRYEGQLNYMGEPTPHPVRPTVRPHNTYYPTAARRAETDRDGQE